MSNYNSLKSTIDANIKQNGVQAITGQILNSVLNAMVTTLGAGYQFAGVATTATNPGSPDAKVFYIANGKGTYTNFGGLEVTEDDVVVLYWDSSWHKVQTGIASQEILSELEEEMSYIIGSPEIELDLQSYEQRKYIPYGNTWNLAGAKHIAIPVVNGESYIVSVNTATVYALLKSYTIPSTSADIVDYCDGFTDSKPISANSSIQIDIPNDCNFLVFQSLRNVDTMPSSVVRIAKEGRLDEIEEEIGTANESITEIGNVLKEYEDVPDTQIDLQSYEQRKYVPYQDKWQLPGAKHIVIPVTKGESYIVVGTTSVVSQYTLLKSYTIPTASTDSVDYCDGFTDLVSINYGATVSIDIPNECNYMVFRADGGRMPVSCIKVGSKGVISHLKELSLIGKTIVHFGDSLTEFKGEDGYRYSDWLQKLYGANVINCGIGGSQIRQRAKKTLVFSTLESYQRGDWVFRKDGNTYKWYEFTQDHNGEWNDADATLKTSNSYAYANFDIINMIKSAVSGDFAEMDAAAEYTRTSGASAISNLKLVDWSKVDIVTVFAGTNDWGGNLGVSGSEDIMTTLGAINVLIKELLTKYPHIKLIWFTPIVRWIDIDGDGQFNPQGFSDVHIEGGYTLKEWSDHIKNEVVLNHIPICDMYNTLGWNKYNFWEYFTRIDKGDRLNDGTHPRKGFKQIAERFNAFIISNL